MLEIRNLKKTYTPKKGVPVTALDNVSLKLPQRGMVFILGKSGSGKSTLLNILGGLDTFDSGEILIKGASSKEFNRGSYDSYRNTYVGFIFQEYNILDEFTVGANIALAVELQGKKADDNVINNILKEVDLEGYGQRKPNELSGGQKQRVAIARALVKNPEIIMADEPTGALDSATGLQVFETLKNLSQNKLVLVVSHDREFSEKYADRIIELSDGHIISDVEKSNEPLEQTSDIEAGLVFEENRVSVPEKYHLTEEDRIAINNYIDSISQGIDIEVKNKSKENIFEKTDESKISSEVTTPFKLIKSSLPLKNAFRIGVSGLKYKKFRLVMTVILSCVALTLFGLADTFGSYDHIKTCTNSICDSNITNLALYKEVKQGTDKNARWSSSGYKISKENIKEISSATGVFMSGVFAPETGSPDISGYVDSNAKLTETDVNLYIKSFSGFVEINQSTLDNTGYTLLAGKLPDGTKNEMAVSELVYGTFHLAGYNNGKSIEKINSYSDLVGKTIKINNTDYSISGIVDTKFDIDRYISLTKTPDKNQTAAEGLLRTALDSEFRTAIGSCYSSLVMIGEGHLDAITKSYVSSMNVDSDYISVYSEDNEIYSYLEKIVKLSDVNEVNPDLITWLDGKKDTLADNEIIISSDTLSYGDTMSYDSLTSELSDNKITMEIVDEVTSKSEYRDNIKIVGIIDSTDSGLANGFVASDGMVKEFASDAGGIYNFAVGSMPTSNDEVGKIVKYCYSEDSNVRYGMNNSVVYELDIINTILKSVSTVFLWIGLGFALFAGLMLANFIGTSIAYKKQEIGILRAIGSRSSDVFKIFFSESFVIAMINFVLACICTLSATLIINNVIRNTYGILITILSFGIRQVVLVLLLCVIIAVVASYIPIKKIASENPIDAIRSR